MTSERWIDVWRVDRTREFPDFDFWVYYVVRVNTKWNDGTIQSYPEHAGSRVIKAMDELAMYQEFCKQMEKRHNITPNNVRWNTQGESNETAEDRS